MTYLFKQGVAQQRHRDRLKEAGLTTVTVKVPIDKSDEIKARAAAGRMNHEDLALAPFCDDDSTLTHPDVFNQCHDAGWLKTTVGSVVADDDCFVYLTDAAVAVPRSPAVAGH